MLLTPGAADTGSVSGDTRGAALRPAVAEIAVGGARTSSVNFMLDGTENNDTVRRRSRAGHTVGLRSRT